MRPRLDPRLDYTEWITRSFVNKAKEGGNVRMLFKTYCGIDYHYCLNLLNSLRKTKGLA
jgi:hypothetical protein